MRPWIVVVAALVAGWGAAAGSADREVGKADCVGWGLNSAYGRMFDPASVETVRGQVMAVELVNPRKGMACGVCLELRTEQETLHVHLGPRGYVARHTGRLAPEDTIEVTGSRVLFKGEPTLIATSFRVGNETVVLRSPRGVPAWGP